MAGFRVRYSLASELASELAEAAGDKQLTKAIARYRRVDLLCVDELGSMEPACGAVSLSTAPSSRPAPVLPPGPHQPLHIG
jgi:hypothetical protein